MSGRRVMYRLLAVSLLVIIISMNSGCKAENGGGEVLTEEELTAFAKEHNARNSLDYEGLYRGILPSASGEGIETEIYLTYDGSYVLRRSYLGKADSFFEQSGKYLWNDRGNTITLKEIDPPNSYFVAENYIIHLDMAGERITGDLAEKYILHKIFEE